MSESPKVTSAEYEDMAAHLRTKAKFENVSMRMADIFSRVGSVDAAVAEGEKRLAALRDEEEAWKQRIERARASCEEMKRQAADLIANAKTEAAGVVAKGKADAAAEVAKVDGALKAKRAQLDQISQRIVEAQRLFAS